ncbi:uncharacterized protein LOC118281523 [Spodoptera frugiperda]|uniref:Uncharacterized protein LOC118281523 n=1 Tax=Spodoptera frugiperda TaxID=7108 RepID=A0A9R0F4U9_SPOFR|nr:uncharacterized protein LOC118281523 [Spodoptera frugiperda]
MDSSPSNRGGLPHRSSPSAATTRNQTQDETIETISTSEIQTWMSSIEQCLNEVSTIASEGKMNAEQKLRISSLCRKVGHGVSQMAVQYQSLKHKALQNYATLLTLKDNEGLATSLSEIKQKLHETLTKKTQESASFADMVKGTKSLIRPQATSSVAIYPSDNTKTSEETKNLVQKIVCPEEMKLKVRGLRKIRNGGVIISTETKDDIQKLKQTVERSTTGLTVDEPQKRKPRILIIGVPTDMAEKEVFKCIYEQNIVDILPTLTKETFLTAVKLSHKSGKRDADSCNYIVEVPASVRKALVNQNRIYINWTSCPVRDFTLVTRCFKCQQYGHASKTCKSATSSCGHCGTEGHATQECSSKEEPPKCATCKRYKKPHNHKTGDSECPARKAAEYRYINSIDYEGA